MIVSCEVSVFMSLHSEVSGSSQFSERRSVPRFVVTPFMFDRVHSKGGVKICI